MKKIVIVGSGIGGSGIGALLSTEKKHDILVLEKSHLIGGRCAAYKVKDKKGREWTFDVGCHIISTCGKGPLGEILKSCGEENMVQWVYTIPKANTMGVENVDKKQKTEPQRLQSKESEKERGINALSFVFRIPPEEIVKYDHISVEDFYMEMSKVQPLNMNKLAISTVTWVQFGTTLAKTSAGEFIRCFTSNYSMKANGYPKGGTGAVPEAYCNIIKKNGGKIRTGKEGTVKKIVVENNKVKGVEVGNDFIPADIVIANSDIKTTVNKLIGEKYFSKNYLAYINGLKWSGQGCTLKLGLDKKVTDNTNLMYTPKVDLKGKSLNDLEIKDLFYASEKVSEVIPLFIVPISNIDPKLAPEGCQIIHCLGIPTLDGVRKLSESEEKQWEKACLNTLLTLWPDLEEHIVVKEFLGTRALENSLGKEGVISGIGPTPDQVGDKRPSMISPIKGLCYCSGDAGGWGVGTELAARAALELYDFFKKNCLDVNKIWNK